MSKKQPEHPITPEQVQEFVRLMGIWKEKLGLTSWRIYKGRRRPVDSLAEVEVFTDDRLARIHVGRDWGSNPPTPDLLETTVIHELLHVLLWELAELAEKQAPDTFAGIEHAVIVPLAETLYKLRHENVLG